MGLGFAPRGHKQHEGDGRTPEGWYRTSDKPWSDFAGAIAIHYPNEQDAMIALADGRLAAPEVDEVVESLAHDLVPPQQTPLGGEVLIHAGGNREDWTLGCMALEDEDLASLRTALPQDQRTWLLVLP
jgi:murein L,D-transpeptidase YafK